jgi:YfiH family protein
MTHASFNTSSSAGWTPAPVAGIAMWRSRVLSQYRELAHVFTPAGFNMSAANGPDAETSFDRRRVVCEALGVPADRLVCGRQVHETSIAHVTAERIGSRQREASNVGCVLEDIDGLLTTERNVPLMALSADCPILLLFDQKRHALALAHSGWRGTVAGMPAKLIESMVATAGVRPADTIAVVAPSAGACCYEIKDDVLVKLEHAVASPRRFVREGGRRMYLDLGGLIAEQLAAAGVPREAIHLPEQCSIHDERFYSYRRQGPGVGHAALIACLK